MSEPPASDGSGHDGRTGRLVGTVAELRAAWPDLRNTSVVGLDLREEDLDWPAARVDRTVLLGCRLPAGVGERLADAGVGVLRAPVGLPFDPFRSHLYTYDELTAGEPVHLDTRIAAWFAASTMNVHDEVYRALHDASLTAAVARFVTGRRVVGFMGGHAVPRDDELYRRVAVLGRSFTRAGYTVATGGGPGVMEAANLGAWLAPAPDAALDDALAILAAAPVQDVDPDAYVRTALVVRHRWPGGGQPGGESLGVPTFLYIDEATTGFASHIAKFFAYSIREDGLLAIARSGVVYAPGSAGTEQELFSDSAQNSLTLYDVRSPMVLLGSAYFERDHPELLEALHRQAAAYGWDDLLAVRDAPDDVLAFVQAHDPDAAGEAGVERRRSHLDA
jgi:predicted Rossmann-fold nucleotide-binding protein